MDGDKLDQSERSGREGVPGNFSGIEAVFGSFADPSFVSPEAPVGPLGRLVGRVTIAWAGAVLQVLSKDDVHAFVSHAHLMLAPGGVFIGVRGPHETPGIVTFMGSGAAATSQSTAC